MDTCKSRASPAPTLHTAKCYMTHIGQLDLLFGCYPLQGRVGPVPIDQTDNVYSFGHDSMLYNCQGRSMLDPTDSFKDSNQREYLQRPEATKVIHTLSLPCTDRIKKKNRGVKREERKKSCWRFFQKILFL